MTRYFVVRCSDLSIAVLSGVSWAPGIYTLTDAFRIAKELAGWSEQP